MWSPVFKKINTIQSKFNGVVAAFVALILIAVGATFVVAESQDGDAQVIDLAAHQRLLVAQIKQTGLLLITALESESDSGDLVTTLGEQVNAYQNGLQALTAGGTLVEGENEIRIPLPSAKVAQALQRVQAHWAGYRPALDVLLEPEVDVASDAFYDATLKIADNHAALAAATETVSPLLKGESEDKLRLLKRILYATVLATTLVSLLGWFFARTSIIRPITRLAAGIRLMAADSDLTQRVSAKSKDEIGQVSGYFNAMAEKFQTIMSDLAAATAGIDREAERLTVIANQTKEGVGQQHGRLESVATSMTEMAASAQCIVDNTDSAARTTSETADAAARGQEAVQESAQQLQSMVESVRRAAQQMDQLVKDSEGIGAIVDVIRGIAEQTNLLALNAAIEAARAGEQGRGFAVVAEEVRSLAQRTQKSTGEIQDMIGRLQVNTEQAAAFMSDYQSQAENSTAHTRQIFVSLEQMIQSLDQVNELNTGIAVAAQEQSRVTEMITQSVTEISSAVGHTAGRAEQTADTGESLNALSSELRRTVQRFKI